MTFPGGPCPEVIGEKIYWKELQFVKREPSWMA
jgi:hypothetical protein